MANRSSWTVGQQQPGNKHMRLISSHVDFSRGYTSGRLGKCFVGGHYSGLFSACSYKEAQTFFLLCHAEVEGFKFQPKYQLTNKQL